MSLGSHQRLFYLDALKAVAIILVVVGHLPSYCYFGWHDNPSLLLPIVSAFHMPLFMMVSGYLTNVDRLNVGRRAKILIPFFVFGFLYAFFTSQTIGDFFSHEAKLGYWYLYVLVVYCLLVRAIKWCKVNLYAGLAVVQLLLVALHFCFHRTLTGTALSTDHLWYLWSSFALGILLRRGWERQLYARPLLSLLVCVAITAALEGVLHATQWDGMKRNVLSLPIALAICVAFFIVFHQAGLLFRHREFVLKRIIKQVGMTIGQHTLHIYVIHYFLITYLNLHALGDVMRLYPSLEFVISPVAALVLAYVCIGMAWVLNRCRLGFVFGR